MLLVAKTLDLVIIRVPSVRSLVCCVVTRALAAESLAAKALKLWPPTLTSAIVGTVNI